MSLSLTYACADDTTFYFAQWVAVGCSLLAQALTLSTAGQQEPLQAGPWPFAKDTTF